MNRDVVRAIVHKDVAMVLRNRGIRVPIILAPILILVVLPSLLVVGGDALFVAVPAGIDGLGSLPFSIGGSDARPQSWAEFVLEVFLAPLFLLIPLAVATVIAADSFAGERERGTLEALLHSPTTDRELLTGKFLAAWLPAVTVSLVGFAVYAALANVLAWPTLGRVFFPSTTWLLLAFWVAPGIAGLGLAVMVIASSQVRSLHAANQIGSFLVLPVVLLMIAQITGVVLLGPRVALLLGGLIWLVAIGTLTVGVRAMKRQRLALRL